MKMFIRSKKYLPVKPETPCSIILKTIYRLRLINLLLIIMFLITNYSCDTEKTDGITVTFPRFSEPIQITDNDHEHLHASYYGITSFDKSERYATVLQTDIKFREPEANEPATLGLVDLNTHEFIPMTQTRAWNFQQGCMAHWLGTSPDSLIIFNDLREGKFVSVIMNVHTKREIKTIPYPVSAVSPDGKEAISINFSRLAITRPGYGYAGGGQDSRMDDPFPNDDGLFLINLETGNSELIVSYDQISELLPPIEEGSVEWFNHTLFSREGSKVYWISRRMEGGSRISISFTVNRDGTDLQRCFPEAWEGVQGSHYDWLNDDELMVTAHYEGRHYGHILFTVGQQDYKLLGQGLLDYDGHGTFSPDEKWMVTDQKPQTDQKIYLMDMKTEAVLPIGRFEHPADYRGPWRCDVHTRWSPKGNIIGFNSTHSGRRQAYIYRLTY